MGKNRTSDSPQTIRESPPAETSSESRIQQSDAAADRDTLSEKKTLLSDQKAKETVEHHDHGQPFQGTLDF